jgi:hypothetical protein
VFAEDMLAYVADAQYLYLLDISDKVIPYIIASRDNIGVPHDLFVDDKNIYAATDNGLVIYNKEDLSFVTSYPISDVSERIFLSNGLTYLSSTNQGLNIVKYIDPTGVEDLESNNISFKLEQNYPNPFNPSTTIKYSIPNVETYGNFSVQLKIYDVLGSEVATLINEKQLPGNYKIEFSAEGLPSGVYFYRLSVDGSGNYQMTKKMTLLK